mgnify:CR=1 FL=1
MKDIMSIKKRLEQKSAINGKAGVAIMSDMLNDEKIRNLVIKHYNSITCENEMKPEIILGDVPVFSVDTEGSICLDENGDPVLTLDFSKADKIMDFIKKHNEKNPDDTIRVRGHVLVWHSQTPDWFFREKYDSQGAYVGKEKMLKRLENYIQKVIEHYDGVNSPYRGIIYAWDVVNEQIEPDDFHPEKNPGSVRYTCNNKNTGWYNIFQGDISYITQSFVFANRYAPKDIKLFYNDYNTYFGVKDTLNLVEFINKGETAKICGGIGMQSHVDVKVPTVAEYGSALEQFLAAGYEIQITELDFTINFDTEGTNASYAYTPEHETDADQAKFVKKLMQTIITKQKNRNQSVNPKGITGITLWGLCDATSWRSQCAPLLFDTSIYDPKLSYTAFLEAAKIW